jgi:hypothetical protein
VRSQGPRRCVVLNRAIALDDAAGAANAHRTIVFAENLSKFVVTP